MSLNKVRIQLLDPTTGTVLQEVDVLTSADSVTFADGQTFQQKLDAGLLKGATGNTGATGATGATGSAGARGSQWFSGTGITGVSTTATIFSGSGVSSALVNDQYYNTATGNVYVCTVAGASTVAKWVYQICLKGQDGDNVKIGTDYATGTEAKVFFKVM